MGSKSYNLVTNCYKIKKSFLALFLRLPCRFREPVAAYLYSARFAAARGGEDDALSRFCWRLVEFCGDCHTGLFRIPRVAWISGSEPPPAVRTPITPLGCPHMPLREDSAVYLYSAHLGGGQLRRGWRALSLAWRCYALFRAAGYPPRGLGIAAPLGAPPWDNCMIPQDSRFCKMECCTNIHLKTLITLYKMHKRMLPFVAF